MDVLHTIADVKRRLRPLEPHGLRIAFVPTMGALHAGHMSLIEHARAHGDIVVASIFVNPLQFGPNEDFLRYPRHLDRDAERLVQAGCDVLFAPESVEMVGDGFQTSVEVSEISKDLCGASRLGHFRGVATIVLKLLSIVHPRVAVFGEKDFQQLAVIRTLVRDLALDVAIVGAPLVRDPDGLAMSSRNAYLSADERARALSIVRGLAAAKDMFEAGERDAKTLVERARCEQRDAGLSPEYLELRAFGDLRPLERADGPCVLLAATRVGKTRLIDNIILARPE